MHLKQYPTLTHLFSSLPSAIILSSTLAVPVYFHISNSNDTGEIIYDIIKPIIEKLDAFKKINLDFSHCVGLQRSPPDPLNHKWNNLPVHNFASQTKFRGPEMFLCYQPGEMKAPSTGKDPKNCEICYRRFENNKTLNLHKSVDHESKNERKKMSILGPDFTFYYESKGDGMPKNKYLPAFDELILTPRSQ